MSILRESFRLLDEFQGASTEEKIERIRRIERILDSSESGRGDALAKLSEISQVERQRVYMLVQAGMAEEAIRATDLLVDRWQRELAKVHEEAAFHLADTALSLLASKPSVAETYGLAALMHAGLAQRISRTLLAALEALQIRQEQKRVGPKD